jgi:GT2 family glycosyltransferase
MNRPERLLACVRACLDTTPGLDVEVIAVIDCDTVSRDLLFNLNEARVRVLFNSKRQGAIACWNHGLAAARGDILVFFNDDCVPTAGWLDAALTAHREQLGGYGLCGFNDGYQDGNKLAVQYLFDRKFCLDVLGGVMAYPVYQFYANDSEANARAKAIGRFYWCREAVVEHYHWSRPGQSHKDALDRENEAKAQADIALFEMRRSYGFPNNFEAVLK